MSGTSGWQVADEAPHHYHDHVWRFMDPFAVALVDSAVIEGDSVLDVACGTGIAARAAAGAAGATGTVVGSDINRPMLDLAAQLSIETGDGIVWREASAMDLPFLDGEFDRVICQQGLQFFPDAVDGLTEMGRVAKTGGTVAVTVWSPLADSPYFEAMYAMLIEFCDAHPDDMNWSSDSREVLQWFAAGGLDAVTVERRIERVALPSLADFVPAHMKATPWATAFASLSASETSAAVSAMAHDLAQWSSTAGVNVPFSSYIAIAPI